MPKQVSASALAAARASAEKNGQEGEALAWLHLQKLRADGLMVEIEWSSQKNAVSAYDFVAVDGSKMRRRIDAKSTSGKFDLPIHISVAELIAAAASGPYDIWRVYGIDGDGARLKIAHDIGSIAKMVLAALVPPQGVTVDGVSIDPKLLTWGPEIVVQRPDEMD